MENMRPFYLAGRGRSGADSTGTLFHALPAGSDLTFRDALCGKKPGRLSNGWSEAWKPGQDITCPKCKKKLAQVEKK